MVEQHRLGGSIFWMLIAALLFGYLGFGLGWAHEWTVDGERIWMVTLLMWTLRVCGVGFLLAAILVRPLPIAGAALYGGLGMIASVIFIIVAAWDFLTPRFSGIHPFLLVFFALINGAASWQELRELFAVMRRTSAETSYGSLP